MNKNLFVTRIIGSAMIFAGLILTTLNLSAQRSGNSIRLKDEIAGYQGTQDFYTYQLDGGVFNSKTDLDDQTLKVAPLDMDAKSVMRFSAIPLSRSSYGGVRRIALVLTFKKMGSADTIMVHNLNNSDMWDERQASYNSINGTSPWSGADGKLIDAWNNTDGLASVSGDESIDSTLIIEFHPHDASARKAMLDSWLDNNNQGFVIRGISGSNEFYSSDAYNIAHRPELIIEL